MTRNWYWNREGFPFWLELLVVDPGLIMKQRPSSPVSYPDWSAVAEKTVHIWGEATGNTNEDLHWISDGVLTLIVCGPNQNQFVMVAMFGLKMFSLQELQPFCMQDKIQTAEAIGEENPPRLQTKKECRMNIQARTLIITNTLKLGRCSCLFLFQKHSSAEIPDFKFNTHPKGCSNLEYYPTRRTRNATENSCLTFQTPIEWSSVSQKSVVWSHVKTYREKTKEKDYAECSCPLAGATA